MNPEELLERLLYRDGLMLIIDKPAGLPVHAGPKGGPNLEAMFDVLRFGLPQAPSLAHRLDRDTSGCLVLGRHRKALAKLGKLFAGGRIDKTYWAVVEGVPAEPKGRIDLSLTKRSTERGWWMKPDPEGQVAITDYEVKGSADGFSWLELYPRTGRTHQIRVHCAEIGCPIVGDPIYGPRGRVEGLPPLHLHARRIVVPLYPNRDPIVVEAEPPPAIRAQLQACGWTPTPPDA